MFKRILVAIDGSPYSGYAVPDAIAIAKCFGSEIFVVHVHEREPGRAGAFPLETPAEAQTVVAGVIKTVQAAGTRLAARCSTPLPGTRPSTSWTRPRNRAPI